MLSPLPKRGFTLSDAIEMAKADLAARLNIEPESISVKRAEMRDMAVQDLECGKVSEDVTLPGLVIGYEVVLEAQGKTYTYRGRGWRMNLCEYEGKRKTEQEDAILEKVLSDLASRLYIKREEIEVVSVERVTWPDTSLGCPEPGKMYAQVLTPGYRIVLKAGGKTYEYHTDTRSHFTICPR